MPDQAPLVQKLQSRTPAVAGGSDATSPVGEAPFAGTVTEASYTPDAAITGVATNNRTLNLVNKGQDGTGTTVVATITYANGTNTAADDEQQLTLSGTAANLVVAQGDIIALQSVHNGTGIADPGGLAQVSITRS